MHAGLLNGRVLAYASQHCSWSAHIVASLWGSWVFVGKLGECRCLTSCQCTVHPSSCKPMWALGEGGPVSCLPPTGSSRSFLHSLHVAEAKEPDAVSSSNSVRGQPLSRLKPLLLERAVVRLHPEWGTESCPLSFPYVSEVQDKMPLLLLDGAPFLILFHVLVMREMRCR